MAVCFRVYHATRFGATWVSAVVLGVILTKPGLHIILLIASTLRSYPSLSGTPKEPDRLRRRRISVTIWPSAFCGVGCSSEEILNVDEQVPRFMEEKWLGVNAVWGLNN